MITSQIEWERITGIDSAPLTEPSPEETAERLLNMKFRARYEQGINGRCEKALLLTQVLTERSLHKTMPVNLLSRPHDQEEKKSDRREAELGLVEIDV
jgi:hypothetical protein